MYTSLTIGCILEERQSCSILFFSWEPTGVHQAPMDSSNSKASYIVLVKLNESPKSWVWEGAFWGGAEGEERQARMGWA